MRGHKSKSEWRSICEDYEVSGLSAAAYCREKDLRPSTFQKWKSKFSSGSVNDSKPSFVELKTKSPVKPKSEPKREYYLFKLELSSSWLKLQVSI